MCRRQQAAADATAQDQCLSLAGVGSDKVAVVDNERVGKGRRNSGGATLPGPGTQGVSAGVISNPLHDFQRWISSAKQRLPAAWTNSVGSRGMTLQISAPIPPSSVNTKRSLEAEKVN